MKDFIVFILIAILIHGILIWVCLRPMNMEYSPPGSSYMEYTGGQDE